MEPPAKRRRKGPPPPALGQNDDEDDELASHPQEITVRRDPDIQFALKRANADHKLQATMAHIIEKYSRDFEGVGDEIDMETGEIVVNNGHLRNMRDEGDVEGLWMDGDNNAEEYEGILLEDLTDEYSDNQDDMNEPQNPEAEDDDQNLSTGEQGSNDGSNTDERAKAPDSIAASANNTKNQDERLSPEARNSKDGEPDGPPRGFNPASLSTGIPHSYGAPPAAFGPWAMMPGSPMHPWGRDDIPPYYNMPPSMPSPWFNGGRYEFPTNDGQTSIWRRSWAKKTKRAGFMKRPSKGHAESSKNPSDNAADEETGGDDGNEKENQGALVNDQVINASDEDDDLIFSGTTDSAPAAKPTPVPLKEKEAVKGTARTKPAEKALEETAGNTIKVPLHNHEKDEGDRRRSGRVRKQVEYMGKISWADAKELRKSGQSLSVELYRADRASRQDFQSVDTTDDESLPIQETIQQGSPRGGHRETEKAAQKQVIPDSQDTATPFNSSAPQPSQPQASQPQASQPKASQPAETQGSTSTLGQNPTPSMVLSDDEAPLVLSRVKAPKQRAASSKPVPQLASLREEHEGSADKDVVPDVDRTEGSKDNETCQAEPGEAIQTEAKETAGSDKPAQPLKRKRGRPRKSETTTKAALIESTIVISHDSAPGPPKRKLGRPRNPSIVTHEAEEAGKPHRLSSELKWLERKKPKGVSDLEAREGVASKRRLRSRESKETLRSSDVNADGPQSSNEEPEAIISNEPPSPARVTLSPKDIPTVKAASLARPISLGDTTSLPKAAPPPKIHSPSKAASPAETASPPKATSPPKVAPENTPSSPMAVSPAESPSPPQTTSPSKTISRADVASPPTVVSPPTAASSLTTTSPPKAVPPANDAPSAKVASPAKTTSRANTESSSEAASPPKAVSPVEGIPPAQDHQPRSNTPQDLAVQQASTPRKNKDTAVHPAGTPSSSSKPQTPRHTSIRTTRAPSSRRSLLSFVSDSDSDSDRSRDELARKVRLSSHKKSARPSTHRKIWRSTALTTELHRTPSRRRRNDPPTPVKTPGGTLRTCGIDGTAQTLERQNLVISSTPLARKPILKADKSSSILNLPRGNPGLPSQSQLIVTSICEMPRDGMPHGPRASAKNRPFTVTEG